MKQLLVLVAFALAAPARSMAQMLKPSQVPAAAQATFRTKFPAAKTLAWEREGNQFEAGFRLRGKTMSAVITPSGELLETETSLAPAQLPPAVRARLASAYRSYTVTEAARIVRADGSTVYEAEIARGGQHQDVLFRADGTLANK